MHFVHRIRLFTAVFSIMSLEHAMPICHFRLSRSWKFGPCINMCLVLVCFVCQFILDPAISVSNQSVQSITLNVIFYWMVPFTSFLYIFKLMRLCKVWKKKLSVFTRMSVECFLMMKQHRLEMQCENSVFAFLLHSHGLPFVGFIYPSYFAILLCFKV